MDNFICDFKDDHYVLKEHLDVRFISYEEIKNYDYLGADYLVFDDIKRKLN